MELDNAALAEVSALAQRQVKQEQALEKAEALLAKAKEDLKYTTEVLLPNAMVELGLSEIRLETGEFIQVERKITASISENHFSDAKDWLVAHNLDGIIKHAVSLSFSKGEGAKAEKALTVLVEAGFTPQDKESIHYQTLNATVREQLGKGVDMPADIFGIFEVVKTKVSLK
jgi:hypothetical protein